MEIYRNCCLLLLLSSFVSFLCISRIGPCLFIREEEFDWNFMVN
jgi:hypothetical protein